MYRSRLSFALAMAALAAILVPSSLTAQITYQRTYGGASEDFGYSVQQTADGGYVIAGYTLSGVPNYLVYVIKTDAYGDTVWTRTFGGTQGDYGHSVQQTTDGGYIITGSTNTSGGSKDVYLIKTSPGGNALWTRTFGGEYDDLGCSVRQTADSGYIITGGTSSFGAGGYDVYLIKTDAEGDTLWTKTYGGMDGDFGNSVRQTADGGYVIAGRTMSFGAGSYDACLIKTDANGDTVWTRTFGDTLDDEGSSVEQTLDGGYVIVGYTSSSGSGLRDVCLIKIDASGDTLWTKTYGGSQEDGGCSVQQTTDSGYIVTGWTESFGVGRENIYLIKTDASGDTLWTRTYGGTDWAEGYSVQQTADGGCIIAGSAYSYGAGGYNVYLIKTDSLGNVGVAEPKTPPTRAPALSLSCEPNPFSGSVTISLSPSIPSSLSLVLRIFDASGRLVLSQPVRTSSFILQASSLPSGVYLARLDAVGQHASVRLILQR